jgi:iron complex outermembrane receptor protein
VLTAVLLALCSAHAAGAQATRDSTRADSSAQKLTPVKVTEKRVPSVIGGSSAVVIRPELLRSSPAPSLEQALRESPFVHVRQNSRGEMELSVRGSDSRQAAVLLDGVPVTLGWDHRTDPSLVPLTGAQNLTIVRGLGTLLNGPNTLGGTIEVAHENAFTDVRSSKLFGGAGIDNNAAYVGSLGASRNIVHGNGALSLRGGFAHRKRPGVTLPSGADDPTAEEGLRTNSDLDQTDAFASARWSNRQGRSLGLTVTGFTAERGVPPEEHIENARLWRYPYHTRALVALSSNSGVFATPFGYGSLEVGGGYNAGRLKIQSFDNREYTSVVSEELGDERTLTSRALFTHTLPRNATFKSAITLADVRYGETLSPAPRVDYRQRLWSFAAEVDTRLASRTSLTGGIALDKSTTLESGGRTQANDAYDAIGWRAGLTHGLNDDWRVHVSASRRSRFPALRELYSGALNRFRPNPDLTPETLLGFEGGFTVDRAFGPIPDATIQVTGFHHRLDDAVVRVTLQNPTRFMRINRDRINSTGAELLAGLVFGSNRDRAFSITGDALIQNISIVDQTAGSAMRHPENNPERRGMLEVGVPLPFDLRGFANVRYTGRQYCLNADSGSEMVIKGQSESDLAVEATIPVAKRGLFQSIKALVSLDNVGNTAVYDQCGLPQPGRTLRVMMTLR